MSWRTWRWWHWFYMYKFRSMVKNADDIKDQLKDKNERKWPLFKISNDPRISWWWKILRKTSLDEIPQMVNVLIWDMSIVWPRPHLPEEVENYKWWHKRLLSIKPWITWYAQVLGRDKLEFDEEAKLDLYYIQNWNMFLDIYVIVNTFKVIFSWR
jgi:lipopolysaccharide/colanic/teichoic acid biosynthesis glycosyltransferase